MKFNQLLLSLCHKKRWLINAWQISLQHQQITISLLAIDISQFYVAHSL